MTSNVEVPTLGESISEAVLVQWHKREGERVKVDEPLCELESDKATVDLPSPASGILHLSKKAGETAQVGEVIARIEEGSEAAAQDGSGAVAEKDSAAVSAQQGSEVESEVQKVKEEKVAVSQPRPQPAKAEAALAKLAVQPEKPIVAAQPLSSERAAEDGTRRERMSKIRRSIAERLVRATQSTAMLTTFNEIDMTAIQELRSRHQEAFFKAHGVRLGLMPFFVRATVLGLKQFPALNAHIDGDDVLYHDYVHLGIAVSTERGLVVPVLRNAETLSVAGIEKEIRRTAVAAKQGKLKVEELSGGTFTITNGGVFGSLLSTPILNPPQTGILGMHTIQERPVAVNRQVEIRPMMYVALTYDHRLVDGQEAVTFLVRIKQLLEDPIQIILDL
jgi:2-oxoglutarate dehydrogenase E2 component (dihydrolipoamide succinyltransferase)